MRRLLVFCFFICALSFQVASADDIVGFWRTVNEKSGKRESVVAIYPYQGKYYGRLIVTFDEDGTIENTIYHATLKAPGVIGNPYYAGLDIIWDLKPEGEKYTDGEILDPERGRIYGAEIWRKGKDLIVRGKVFFLGRNQTWPEASEEDFPPGFAKPDLTALVPVIPKPLRR